MLTAKEVDGENRAAEVDFVVERYRKGNRLQETDACSTDMVQISGCVRITDKFIPINCPQTTIFDELSAFTFKTKSTVYSADKFFDLPLVLRALARHNASYGHSRVDSVSR